MLEIYPHVYFFAGQGYNCNCYIIQGDESSLIIDSGLGKYGTVWGDNTANQRIFENILTSEEKNYELCITHAHLDHSGGIMSLNNNIRNKIKILAHKDESRYLEEPNRRYIDPITKSTSIKPIFIDKKLENENIVSFGDFELKIIHTPGHTSGSICLYEREKKLLFSGDTVFPEGSFGRVDFPGSNPELMIESLELITSLDVIGLFAGHMNPVISTEIQKDLMMSYKIAKEFI
ncbi:MAG: MBL fold metallo-hydrolase [Candidatus Thorarchaeota archaeon]